MQERCGLPEARATQRRVRPGPRRLTGVGGCPVARRLDPIPAACPRRGSAPAAARAPPNASSSRWEGRRSQPRPPSPRAPDRHSRSPWLPVVACVGGGQPRGEGRNQVEQGEGCSRLAGLPPMLEACAGMVEGAGLGRLGSWQPLEESGMGSEAKPWPGATRAACQTTRSLTLRTYRSQRALPDRLAPSRNPSPHLLEGEPWA